MQLLNLAIAFALFALVGCVIMLMGNPLGLAMIIFGEFAAFICVWTWDRSEKRKQAIKRIFG